MLLHKEVYYEDDNFSVYIEYADKSLCLHVDCWNWKPSVFKMMLRVFHTMREEAKEKGFERLFTISPNPKFCHLFCGTTIDKINYENKEYEVVVWDLK